MSSAAPPYVDTTKASVARVYDAFLNGTDNYEIDREVLRRIQQVAPEATFLGRDNREFLNRASRFIAGQTEITQYLDCGSGLPTAENTHQVVQRVHPEARVVYVDNDPAVLSHGRALLEENDRTHLIGADIFEPSQVLDNEVVREELDLSQPIALYQCGTLHHYSGERSPADIMREYIDALPSGSYVALSHFFDPETTEDSALARKMEDAGGLRLADRHRVDPGAHRLADERRAERREAERRRAEQREREASGSPNTTSTSRLSSGMLRSTAT